jgi:hypothetical protein
MATLKKWLPVVLVVLVVLYFVFHNAKARAVVTGANAGA